MPVEDVELGPNLVENGGFEAWVEGRQEWWKWSACSIASRSVRPVSLVGLMRYSIRETTSSAREWPLGAEARGQKLGTSRVLALG